MLGLVGTLGGLALGLLRGRQLVPGDPLVHSELLGLGLLVGGGVAALGFVGVVRRLALGLVVRLLLRRSGLFRLVRDLWVRHGLGALRRRGVLQLVAGGVLVIVPPRLVEGSGRPVVP